jgi:hypothetical protein
VSIRFRFPPVADACGAPVLRDQGPIGRARQGRYRRGVAQPATWLRPTVPTVAHANIQERHRQPFAVRASRHVVLQGTALAWDGIGLAPKPARSGAASMPAALLKLFVTGRHPGGVG